MVFGNRFVAPVLELCGAWVVCTASYTEFLFIAVTIETARMRVACDFSSSSSAALWLFSQQRTQREQTKKLPCHLQDYWCLQLEHKVIPKGPEWFNYVQRRNVTNIGVTGGRSIAPRDKAPNSARLKFKFQHLVPEKKSFSTGFRCWHSNHSLRHLLRAWPSTLPLGLPRTVHVSMAEIFLWPYLVDQGRSASNPCQYDPSLNL